MKLSSSVKNWAIIAHTFKLSMRNFFSQRNSTQNYKKIMDKSIKNIYVKNMLNKDQLEKNKNKETGK